MSGVVKIIYGEWDAVKGGTRTSGHMASFHPCPLFISIMSAAMGNVEPSVLNMIDQAVFVVDTAAKLSPQVAGECLRLSNPHGTAVALNVLNQLVDPFQGFLVLGLPV